MTKTVPFKLYNTLTRSVEPLQPLQPGKLAIYTCGPTVYNRQHIGNFRAFINEDVLVKALRHFGYQVTRVMNITDVGHLTSDEDEGEDKLQVGAKREGTTAWEVAKKYEQLFLEDAKLFNVEQPAILVRATETIAEQITLIQQLEAKGFTYKTADGIYYDSSKFDHYGDLAHLDIAGLRAGARVAVSEGKKLPTDFALWKFSPSGEKRDMEWESPWGVGFPGWHIECSAIALKELGNQMDIHCGGVEHIPIHHTNEIAQSEAVTGQPFARVWMHNEHLLVDGGKMAKSLGNGYTLADLEERGIDPLAFRLFCFNASYRSKLNFTWEALEAAQVSYDRLRNVVHGLTISETPEGTVETIDTLPFQEALANDLNMPEFMAQLWVHLRSNQYTKTAKLNLVRTVETVLCLDLEKPINYKISVDDQAVITELLEARKLARQEKDWVTSDRLREEIESRGYELTDTNTDQLLTKRKK